MVAGLVAFPTGKEGGRIEATGACLEKTVFGLLHVAIPDWERLCCIRIFPAILSH